MVILGTPAYMSPEQACCKDLDARTDIWSFGCVLYESLTGKPAFTGATVAETLAEVLEGEPDWNALPPSTPANIRALLRRCLEKDPRKRLRHIGDAGIELDEVIAEGLEAAHARDIMHRDLKPANIKVGEDGQVKVLDFGLAKCVSRTTTAADTMLSASEKLTGKMAVVGTPTYMSPEQACGKDLDSRTDIWSFGCVLYESLAGKAAFRGATVTEILAAIVEREPDWDALPRSTPANIRVLLRRCLQKDPQRRLRHIGDAAIELDDSLAAA